LKFLVWLVRLGPLPLVLIAAAILGGGFYSEIDAQKKDAARAAAIAAGPPEVVDIAAFDPQVHVAPFDEVRLNAQLDLAMDYQLTIERDGADDLGYMVPLLAQDAVPASQDGDRTPIERDALANGPDWPEVVGVAIFTDRDFDFDQIDGTTLASQAKAFGRFGPITVLNGRQAGGLGMWDEIVRDSFAEQNRAFPRDPIVIFPYVDGRAAALSPRQGDTFSLFDMSKIVAGIFGVLGLLKMVIHVGSGRPKGDVAPAPKPARMAARPESRPDPARDAAATPAPQGNQPPWKTRLAEKTGFPTAAARVSAPAPAAAPEPPADDRDAADAIAALYSEMQNDPDFTRPEFDPGFEKARRPTGRAPVVEAPGEVAAQPRRRNPDFEVDFIPEPQPERRADRFRQAVPEGEAVETRRSGLSLVHKLVLGIVGLAFAVILGAVLMSLFETAAENDVRAAELSPQEILAAEIAQRFAPATPPDQRAWYEVDIAPVAQWFIAKGLLAAAGDKAAIITLLSMGVGLFTALFMLRWFFFARATLTPRISPDLRGMGIN